jgi:hypothetical protein
MFPLDMPWGGDWYLWCAFALHYDVAYMAEPMVCYRRHDGSMTIELLQGNIDACYSDDIKIPWIIKAMVDQSGRTSLSRACLRAIAKEYAHNMTGKQYKAADSSSTMTSEQFEHSLRQHTNSTKERAWVRARVYSGMADRYYHRGDFANARQCYYRGLHEDPLMPTVLAKWLLVSCGRWGIAVRSRTARGRRWFSRVAAQ